MNVFDVIIAALLHDVGKPMQRSELEKIPDTVGYCPQSGYKPSHLHVEWTNSFFQQYCPEFEISSKLASSHHKIIAFAPESERWAAEIIRIADCVASSHDRNEKGSRQDYKSNLLHPIFPKIKLTKNLKESNSVVPLLKLNDFLKSMVETDEFYSKIESVKKVGDYKKLTENFVSDFKILYKDYGITKNIILFINGLDQLIKEYFWCVPANTQEKKPTGSLYNHSKITALISCALYQYFEDKDKEQIFKLKTDDDLPRFLIIGGELNGIQKYIYDMNPEHAQKTAKILRARSFKVKIYSDMALHFILEELQLVQQNVILNAGGKFLILAPANNEIKQKMQLLKSKIEEEMFKKTQGFLTLNLNWDTDLSLADFKTDVKSDINSRSSRFQQIVSRVFADFDLTKRQKFSSYLQKKSTWNSDRFRIEESLTASTICNICKRKNTNGNEICDSCTDEIELGMQLQHKKFGVIGKKLKKPLIKMFSGKLCFSLVSELETSNCNVVSNEYFSLSETPRLLPLKANAVSLPSWKEHYSYFFKKEEVDSDFLTFSELSKLAYHLESDNSYKGVPYLGILKGDVDNLGLIFNKGIEEDYNVTVWSTLSSQIEVFFSRFIPELINQRYSEIYTLYTGGDDFVLIGPWNKLMDLTLEIQKKFSIFCINDEIHFSAGVSLFHGKDPVKYAIDESEVLLGNSKNNGRDRITIFDTTVTWDEFYEQLDIANDYKCWMREGLFSMQNLYKLFEFNRMYLKYKEEGNPNDLMYISRLHYDFSRNVYNKRNVNQQYLQQIIDHEKELATRESSIMKNLKIALHIATYSNRKGGKDV